MLSELPDLDEDVSFVVDDGASTGPVPLRLIVASVMSGQRASNVLVWWAGATDWIQLDSHPDLVALLKPPDVGTGLRGNVVEAPASDVEESSAAVAAEFADPIVEQFVAAQQFVSPESSEPLESVEPVGDARVDEVGDDDDGDMGGAFSFGLPIREAAAPAQDDATPAALTGLFSSGAREQGGLSASEPQAPSPDALDAIMAARVSLESVGARIDALTSATRRTSAPEQQQDEASASIEDLDGGLEGLTDDRESVLIASVSSVEEATVDVETASVESNVSTGGSWRAVEEHVPAEDSSVFEATDTDTDTDAVVDVPVANEVSTAHKALTERFEEMVRRSESHQRRIEWVMRVDELLLSACITAIADSDFVAMDLTSRESDHRVLFDHNSDSRQVRLELSPVDTVSGHLGRHVRLGLSWGRAVGDIDSAFETVERESVGELIPPGVLTCETDMSTGVVSTHVELILAADDFVKDDYSVDRPSLDTSIAATLHALEEHWHVLFD